MSITKLKEEIAELVGKLEQVDAKVADKKKRIKELERLNAEVIESSLNKRRLPAIVTQRRGKIIREQTKSNELVLVRSNLQEKLTDASKKLHKTEMIEKAKSILEQVEVLIHLYKSAQEYLKRYNETVNEIHNYQRKPNALHRLELLCQSLNGVSKEDIGIDLNRVIDSFANMSIVDFSDNAFIENIEIDMKNALARINATNSGSRGYPVIKHKPYAKPPVSDIVINRAQSEKYNREMAMKWRTSVR